MPAHTRPHAAAVPPSYEELIQFWQDLDEAANQLRPATRHTQGVVVAAWCFYACTLLATLMFLPLILRSVGHALD